MNAAPNPSQNRATVESESLHLPASLVPRPGDSIIWYSGSVRSRGTLVGYTRDGRASIVSEFSNPVVPLPLNVIRRDLDKKYPGPNWTSLAENAVIVAPMEAELAKFIEILGRPIPPGPSYLDYMTEIWCRGFEVFLVGGTVRDVLQDTVPNDVDLVTSMPREFAQPLLKSMHGTQPSFCTKYGFCRLGGTPRSGDPFIDLKMFFHDGIGTNNPVFGSNLSIDVAYRDFACNAIYYDPFNKALIDPTSFGLEDAENRRLRLVGDPKRIGATAKAKIVIRCAKFLARHYTLAPGQMDHLQDAYVPQLPSLTRAKLVDYIRAQILSKCPATSRSEHYLEFAVALEALVGHAFIRQHLSPLEEDILA